MENKLNVGATKSFARADRNRVWVQTPSAGKTIYQWPWQPDLTCSNGRLWGPGRLAQGRWLSQSGATRLSERTKAAEPTAKGVFGCFGGTQVDLFFYIYVIYIIYKYGALKIPQKRLAD